MPPNNRINRDPHQRRFAPLSRARYAERLDTMPTKLQAVTKLQALTKLLNSDEVRAKVTKDGAFFDSFAGVMIAMYFTKQRFLELHNLVVDKLSFDQKMRVLERLPYQRRYKSIAAMPVIRQVQQIRNLLAHEYYIHERHEKLNGANWLPLFENYPASYDKPVQLAKMRLRRLSGSREFLEQYHPRGQHGI